MTNSDFESKHPRGNPKNKGSFSEKDNSGPESTLGDPPTVIEREDGNISLTKVDDTTYRVEGVNAPYQTEFFRGPDTSEERLREIASQLYDFTALGALEQHRRDLLDAGGLDAEANGKIARLRAKLGFTSEWDDIEPGNSRLFDGLAIEDDAIDQVEIIKSDAEELSVEGSVHLDLTEVLPTELSDGEKDNYLNDHNDLIEAWFHEHYGADLDGNSDDWKWQQLTFRVSERDLGPGVRFPADLDSAIVLVQNDTRIVELHNDLNGAYGGKHLYGPMTRLRQHLEAIDDRRADEDEAERARERTFEDTISREGR